MKNKSQIIFAVCAFFLATFFVFAPLIASAYIVPCGNDSNGNGKLDPEEICTTCDLYKLADKILDFLLIDVAVPLATIAFLIGGFLMLISGGNEQKLTSGKKAFTGAIIGLAIAFASWVIVDTTLHALSAKTFGIKTSVGKYLPWNEFPQCQKTKPIEVQQSPIATTTLTSTATRQFAHELWSKGVCGGTASCGGVNACTTLREVATGNLPSVCFNGCAARSECSPKSNVQLDPKMLQAISLMKNLGGLNFVISSLTTGSHAENSKHYQGKAVDLVPQGTRTDKTYPKLEEALKKYGAQFVQCELRGSPTPCSSFRIDHIHAESFSLF